jgi:riboflavin synthase
MFTGLVETTARVGELDRAGAQAKLALAELVLAHEPLQLGESISVNGVCLTVTRVKEHGFEADVSAETLAVTTLGSLRVGSEVNIERSLRVGDRLGGHIVLGHVDGVGDVSSVEQVGDACRTRLAAPSELARFIAAKGSIAIDGVSLTVNRVEGVVFEVMLVPHTLAVTTLKNWRAGQKVNIEVDVLARYVARQADSPTSRPGGDEALMAKLREGGFLS